VAVRQLSVLYMTAASAFALTIALSHQPVSGDGEAEAFVRDIAEAFSPEKPPVVAELQIAPFNAAASDVIAVRSSSDASSLRSAKAPYSPPADTRDRESQRRYTALTSAHRHGDFARRSLKPMDLGRADLRSPASGELAAADRGNVPAAATRTPSAPELAARIGQRPLGIAPDTAAPSASISQSQASIPPGPGPSTDEIAAVEQRLEDNLTPEMIENFELFLYVSKAARGPVAQHMYVFEKQPGGDLDLTYDWLVSTGREKVEYNAAGRKLPSFTPAGYFELDPHRFYKSYWSHQWNEPMPYSMFFNWIRNGQKTGLAIHSASADDIALLGTRASAGCIRLPPDAARTLFELIRTNYRGLAPRFAINHRTGTMSRDGIVLHDPAGHVRMAEGYKVLVFIEDYGGENIVAAVY
jgi:hypothetical protein